MKFQPLNDRILIQRTKESETTSGGIIIPDSAKEKPVQGEVVAAGEGKILDNGKVRAIETKVGQTVFFRKYAGTDIEIDGQSFLIMREDEVLAILE